MIKKELFRVVEFKEEEADNIGYSNYSYWKSTFRTFFKNKVSCFLLILMLVLVLMSFLYPLFSNVDPGHVELNPQYWNNQPSREHIFGTDNLGRDIWARTWHGTKTSLLLGFTVALFDIVIGTIVGAFWGYVKRIDRIMMEIYNIISNIPSTVYLILLAYIMGPSFWTIVIALSSRGWISIGRFVRNKVLTIRDSEYNIASRTLGTPVWRIVFKNIIPFLVSIIILETALTIPYTIGSEVFLGFIGLGLPDDIMSLGNIINQGKAYFEYYPWQLTYPTIVLSFITISFYIVGNKFSDASDPRNHV